MSCRGPKSLFWLRSSYGALQVALPPSVAFRMLPALIQHQGRISEVNVCKVSSMPFDLIVSAP